MTNDIQFPILMTRRSCWEPERFADSSTAYNQNEYDSLKSKGFVESQINIKGTITMRVSSKHPNLEEIERCRKTR